MTEQEKEKYRQQIKGFGFNPFKRDFIGVEVTKVINILIEAGKLPKGSCVGCDGSYIASLFSSFLTLINFEK